MQYQQHHQQHENASIYRLLTAADFAAYKHRNHRRKNTFGTPYINHPIGVAQILSDCYVLDVDVLIAAILHDTMEDTDTTLQEVSSKFGPRVGALVTSVSDDKSLPKHERKRLQVCHAREASKDTRLIKLADKLHNISDLCAQQPKGWGPERVQGYCVWSQAVIEECRGSNEQLEERLDAVLSGQFVMQETGETYDCIPKDVDLSAYLEDYYKDMAEAGKVEDALLKKV